MKSSLPILKFRCLQGSMPHDLLIIPCFNLEIALGMAAYRA